MRIYKYNLRVTDTQIVNLPKGYKALCVQIQNGMPCLWALVDETKEPEPVQILTYGTGHPVHDLDGFEYVSTYQVSTLVFHTFISINHV